MEEEEKMFSVAGCQCHCQWQWPAAGGASKKKRKEYLLLFSLRNENLDARAPRLKASPP